MRRSSILWSVSFSFVLQSCSDPQTTCTDMEKKDWSFFLLLPLLFLIILRLIIPSSSLNSGCPVNIKGTVPHCGKSWVSSVSPVQKGVYKVSLAQHSKETEGKYQHSFNHSDSLDCRTSTCFYVICLTFLKLGMQI